MSTMTLTLKATLKAALRKTPHNEDKYVTNAFYLLQHDYRSDYYREVGHKAIINKTSESIS